MKTRNMLSARVLQFIFVTFIAGPVFSAMVAAQTYTDDQNSRVSCGTSPCAQPARIRMPAPAAVN